MIHGMCPGVCGRCVCSCISYICCAETPLTLAVSLARPRDVILALVEGGALLDFRSRSGLTPVHVAAKLGSCEAIKVGDSFKKFCLYTMFSQFELESYRLAFRSFVFV